MFIKHFFLLLSLAFCLHAFAADTIRLQRASNNTVYVADASKLIKPGSVVQLSGDYLYYKVFNVQGTIDSPIVFINKGLVRIGGFTAYTFQVQGQHFIINGSGDPAYSYGILLNYDTSVHGSSFGFCPNNSSDFEVHHIECMNAGTGVLQNPTYGEAMNNVFYHHLYIHDLSNPNSSPPGRAEAFYLGSTKDTVPYHAAYNFHNCRIEDCRMENLTGDGIQVGHGDFILRRDTVHNFAMAHIPQQDNGIQIGQGTSAIIDSVVVDSGTGIGMQAFGTDSLIVTNCIFRNVSAQASLYEDVIYINGKGPVPLNMRFENNVIISCSGRYGINNATPVANTNGSVFINNFIGGTYTKSYSVNKTKDQWITPIANKKRDKLLIKPVLMAINLCCTQL